MEQQNSVPPVTTTTTEPSYDSMAVDPFLVEALQNPRHRLTILRMELDIQKLMQNPEQNQFEFEHFPTSYLRLAAHRVAQHYGLQTMVQDNFLDSQGIKILVRKLPESKYPTVCLSDIPAKQSENEKQEHVKIVLKPRPKCSSDGTNKAGKKCNSIRSVEERKEDYVKARARIFSTPLRDENEEGFRNSTVVDLDTTSRVAILRDREKDLTDPDYDCSYQRYVRNVPVSQGLSLYDSALPQVSLFGYRNPYAAVVGLNQMQWPSHSMMYAHSYDQFRHAVFQEPFCQQPLSFDYSHNR